jgi:hypothetical protein
LNSHVGSADWFSADSGFFGRSPRTLAGMGWLSCGNCMSLTGKRFGVAAVVPGVRRLTPSKQFFHAALTLGRNFFGPFESNFATRLRRIWPPARRRADDGADGERDGWFDTLASSRTIGFSGDTLTRRRQRADARSRAFILERELARFNRRSESMKSHRQQLHRPELYRREPPDEAGATRLTRVGSRGRWMLWQVASHD